MSRETGELVNSIRNWVEATRAKGWRAFTASAGGSCGPGAQLSSHRGDRLGALSALGFGLLESRVPSVEVLEKASIAFEEVSRSDEAEQDDFGERSELRCRFSFVAWRHARALGRIALSSQWLEAFDCELSGALTARECTNYFLLSDDAEASASLSERFLGDAESLLALTSILRTLRNQCPARLCRILAQIREWVASHFNPSSFHDERNYFLGQLELSAAICARWAGDRQGSFEMLARAESFFSGGADSEIGTVEVGMVRLIAKYEMARCDEILQELPPLQARASSLGMVTALAKSWILEAEALKSVGRIQDSFVPLRRAFESEAVRRSSLLRTFVLEFFAESCTIGGMREEAATFLNAAASTLNAEPDAGIARTFLKLLVAENLVLSGDSERAISVYLEAREDWRGQGAQRWIAYTTLLIAEALLLAGRDREGEAEVLGILPMLDRLKLFTECAGALTILRESVRRRQTDRAALREVANRLR